MIHYIPLYMGVILSSWAARTLRTYVSGRLNSTLLYRMRLKTYNHLCSFDPAYVLKEQAGKIISLISNDILAVGNVLTSENIDIMINTLTIVGSPT